MPSTKTASKLDAAAKELRPGNPLAVLVQVNTSGEECECASWWVFEWSPRSHAQASLLCRSEKRRGARRSGGALSICPCTQLRLCLDYSSLFVLALSGRVWGGCLPGRV